ncbi:Ig-like domain-containing protein, partial [Nitratireductor pacificus]
MANEEFTRATDQSSLASGEATSSPLNAAKSAAQAVAQADTAQEPVPVDPATGQPVVQPTVEAAGEAVPETVTADANNVVHLPEGVSIDQIRVDGDNLVLVQPDGSTITILNAALKIPTFLLGDVEIPQLALTAALQANGINVAAGPDGALTVVTSAAQSGGGNFAQPAPGIGDAGPLIDLLPPTALQFGTLDRRELFPALRRENDLPTLGITPLSGTVDEAALSTEISQGSGGGTTKAVGAININAGGDGLGSLVVKNADGETVDVTNGGAIEGAYGTLIITRAPDGSYSFEYELTRNSLDHAGAGQVGSGDVVGEQFEVIVTDGNGDSVSSQIDIVITDDGPVAVDDVVGQASENAAVTIDAFANDAAGADGVNLVNGVALVPDTLSGGGALVYNADGTFTYTPASGEEGTVTFDYTITDGDGDVSTATVTLELKPDSVPEVTVIRAEGDDGVVWESALPDGSGGGDLTASGGLTIDTGDDTLDFIEVQDKDGTWIEITADGTSVQGVYGTLLVDLDGSWVYTLADNTLDHTGVGQTGSSDQVQDAFAVRVTDSDGDTTDGTAQIVVDINDDGPAATDDGI